MTRTQIAPFPFAPSTLAGHPLLTEAEAAEYDAWLMMLPLGPEQCEVCRGPASPCIAGRCLACSGECDPILPLPWAHVA
jgi:hypothetical protein